jgi:LAGLIDADG-like domain
MEGFRRVAHDLGNRDNGGMIRKQAHDPGDPTVCAHCYAGETRYWTRQGIRTLAETAGTVQEVLTNCGAGAVWREAAIHSFGEQRLWRVELRRNKLTKVLYATDGHRWLVRDHGGSSAAKNRIVLTKDLKHDHRLAWVLPKQLIGRCVPSPFGIAHGIVYGDGTRSRKGSVINLWGEKDSQLIRYFAENRREPVKTPGGVDGMRILDLPGFFKDHPSLDESVSYLYGWLAGYFAADGSVNSQGQAVLCSASRENLEFAQHLGALIGISSYDIVSKIRQGYGEASELHQVQLIGSTLRPEFFLTREHRLRYEAVMQRGNTERIGWTVVSSEPTERVEEVFCPSVPEHENFVLDGWINTMNCPFCGSGQIIGQSDGTIACEFCFSGGTEYLTWEGIRTFKETVGTVQRVLSSRVLAARGASAGTDTGGAWVDAEIRSFGRQRLMRVTLGRQGCSKVVYATPEHRWLVTPFRNGYRHGQRVITSTQHLAAGQRLAPLYPKSRLTGPSAVVPSPFAVAHGFSYGDGCNPQRLSSGGRVVLWGEKDLALEPYFPEACRRYSVSSVKGAAGRGIDNLPRFFKERPSPAEALSYLYGWLAGYFAADGSVSKTGAIKLSSAHKDELDYYSALCAQLGIGTYEPRSYLRKGIGGKTENLWDLRLIGKTLRPEFFIIPEHRRRFGAWLQNASKNVVSWYVTAVEETDREEEVFCAVVPEYGNFTLAGNINVMNCGQVFLVRVQPQFPGMPQAEGGEAPTDAGPDIPGGLGDMGMGMPPGGEDEEEGGFPPGEEEGEGSAPGEDGEDEEDSGPPADEDEDSGGQPFQPKDKRSKGKGGKPFQKKSYRTLAGDDLPEDAYIRHLAAMHGGAPALAQLRREAAARGS